MLEPVLLPGLRRRGQFLSLPLQSRFWVEAAPFDRGCDAEPLEPTGSGSRSSCCEPLALVSAFVGFATVTPANGPKIEAIAASARPAPAAEMNRRIR